MFATDWIDVDLTCSPSEYTELVEAAFRLKAAPEAAKRRLLDGRAIYFIFFNQSLRTRSSFHTGLEKMGGHAVHLQPGAGIYTPALAGQEIAYATERVSDTARVLSEYGDGIAIRMYGDPSGWVYGSANAVIKEFAIHAQIPVINMECDRFHPCQALADVMTMREYLGDVKGRRLTISWAYSESWHKPVAVPQSLLLAAAKSGMKITLAHPPGFELDPRVLQAAQRFAVESEATIDFTDDFKVGLSKADIVYAKSWCSLGCLPKDRAHGVDEQEMIRRFDAARHWCVDDDAMGLAAPSARYMHCLPADRGQEVADSVIDGAQSLVYQQAANRLHGQNAVMLMLLNPGGLP